MKKSTQLIHALSLVAALSCGALTQLHAANPTASKTPCKHQEESKGTTVAPTPQKDAVWNSCRAKQSCEYPGKCHGYVDSNQNKICDRGEAAPTPTGGGCSDCSACPTPCYEAKK